MTNKDFHLLVGQLAIGFSLLEFLVQQILCALVDPHIEAIGGMMASDMSLAQKIEKIKKLVRFRLICKPRDIERIIGIMGEVNALRKERNRLIHGMWLPNEADLQKDFVRYMDTKLDDDHENKTWGHSTEDIPLPTLIQTRTEVQRLAAELSKLQAELHATDMIGAKASTNPNWSTFRPK